MPGTGGDNRDAGTKSVKTDQLLLDLKLPELPQEIGGEKRSTGTASVKTHQLLLALKFPKSPAEILAEEEKAQTPATKLKIALKNGPTRSEVTSAQPFVDGTKLVDPHQARFSDLIKLNLSWAFAAGTAIVAGRFLANTALQLVPLGIGWLAAQVPTLAIAARSNVESFDKLVGTVASIAACSAVLAVVSLYRNSISDRGGRIAGRKVIEQVVESSVAHSAELLDRPDVQNRLTKIRENLGNIIGNSQAMFEIAPGVVGILCTTGALLGHSPALAVVIAGVGLWKVLQGRTFGQEMSIAADVLAEPNRKIWYKSYGLRDADGIQEIKHMGKAKALIEDHLKDLAEFDEAHLIVQTRHGLRSIWSSTAVVSTLGVATAYGLFQFISGELTLSQGLFIGAAATQFSASVTTLSDGISKWLTTREFAKEAWAIIETGKMTALNETESKLEEKQRWMEAKSVELREVSVSVPVWDDAGKATTKTKAILEGITFSIRPGELVGIVGVAGAGKSTLLKVLLGSRNATSGSVKLGDQALMDIPLAEIRANTTLLPQVYLSHFGRSIRENIELGCAPWETEVSVEEAAELSGLTKMMEVNGFTLETVNGTDFNNGRKLSPGEIQEIALTRALIKGGSLVILDEPTSKLDPESAARVVENLKGMTGKTRLLVSHDMGLVNQCDRILVIGKRPGQKDGPGVVEAFGTHEEVLLESETYRNFYQKQKAAYQ